ncbi:hypothetical protein [Streptomyces sp. WM4235]|uniref:hypothetical protein n=1 Tax=Streptomyces sp. WM4235 TaxID=1415551 RepID=UPI00131B9E7C|nr:hypothetical protein [Streptomyces sp. WM4235]
MTRKTVDVTLASIANTGINRIGPMGVIVVRTVRAVDDEQVFQSGGLYARAEGEPMHPSGVQGLAPGESLTYNVTQRLAVSQFEEESVGHLNQMLILDPDLMQRIVESGTVTKVPYFGCSRRRIRFDDIDGFQAIDCLHNASFGTQECRFTASYTVNLISTSG